MKRGFNRYSQNGEDDSEPNSNGQGGNFPNFNYGLINQFANFSPGNQFSEGMIMTLFQIVEQQSRALQGLMSKVDSITQKTVELTEKIKDLKKIKREERETDLDQGRKECLKGETLKGGGDIIQAPALIKILFGAEKRYEYRLQLAQKLDQLLYRERNFFLEIQLRDLNGNIIKNSNKIPLSLALYSSQNPPKFIEKNTAGQKILKGYVQQSLHQGACRFEKIQIKQVTSHFRNGWVFIVIIPSMTPLGSASPSNEHFIDYTKIEPLVLDKIVVKAKKLKQPRRGAQLVEHGVEDMELQEEPNKLQEQNKMDDPIYSQQK